MNQNVLFVNPPSIPFADLEKSFSKENLNLQTIAMPMGLMYISSYLKEHNNVGEIGIIDYALEANNIISYGSIEQFIVKFATNEVSFVPDIIAFSLIFSTAHPFFNYCIPILKSKWPQAVIVVGGTHATNCTPKLLLNRDVDYVLRGEGEIGFSKLVQQISEGQEINVKGVYSRANIDKISLLELGDIAIDLDELPYPDWNLVDMSAYTGARGRSRQIGEPEDHKIATILTTRGCPFKCTFCSGHTVKGRQVRYRSTENITKEVKELYNRYNVTTFIPEDDLFTAKEERVVNLLRELKALNIPNYEMQFPSGLSVNTLNEQIIDALIEASMKFTNLAIESGSEYVQKYVIKKNCNLKKAPRLVKYLREKGVMVRIYYILGFPSETKEQMRETIEYAKALGADWSVFMIATPLIGTEMYDQFVQLGYIKDDIEMWSKAFYQERSFDTPEISAVELNELSYQANLEVNFFHNPNKESGRFEKAIDIYNDICIAYPFHIVAWYCIMECYLKMGKIDEAQKIYDTIFMQIDSDKRSAEMFTKYGDMMPILKTGLLDAIESLQR